MKAFDSIDRRLESDGRMRGERLDFGGVTQTESIDGIPIRIGGNILLLLLTPDAKPPKDPATNEPN